MSILQKWAEYQPQKSTVVWGVIGGSVLTMVVGFMWGGWVTGGTARSMAEEAARASHAELASAICVENFQASSQAREHLQELVELSSFRQRQFVESAAWAVLPDGQKLGREAVTLCTERVAAINIDELPAPVETALVEAVEPVAAVE